MSKPSSKKFSSMGPVTTNYFQSPSPINAAIAAPPVAPTFVMPSGMPLLTMPLKSQMFVGPDLRQQQQQEEQGELTPRGVNRRPPPVKMWSCTPIIAWMALILSFVALVFVAIVYFNMSAMSSELKRHRSLPPALPAAEDDTLSPKSRQLMEVMRHLGHNHTHYVKFELSGVAGQFSRWPPNGIIEGLEFTRLANMRVCCHLSDQYFVCDSGQGATNNIGLECIVRHVAADKGTHLLVYVQSAQMNGAQCTFMWQTRDANDPLLADISNKDDNAITNEIVANQKEI
jgi:hypothetical protein